VGLTNVEARGVNTVEWLAEAVTTIAVPVYQRHYRWDLDRCSRLLEDIRAVADAGERQTHFIGSILATADTDDAAAHTLIDGQQRLTTLTLLAAALHSTVHPNDPALAGELRRLLVHPSREGGTKLLPHRGRDKELADIIGGRAPQREPGESPFNDNYEFFLREVQRDADRVWRGLRRLEHVFISLRDNAHPQQVFESLNSTGAPLKNHELVHNYVLMRLSHAEQTGIEDEYWIPIEQNTGDRIDGFLRDYLIQRTGRDSEFVGEHGVYGVFKKEFPGLTADSLTRAAEEWRELSEVYHILLNPVQADDSDIAAQFGYVNVFGSAMYPLVMAVYRDYQRKIIGRYELLETLEGLQSLFLRKMVVGESRDHLAAQLCRRLNKSRHSERRHDQVIREIVRRTPSNERVANALKYRTLPHAGYVLQRLETDGLKGLELEREIARLKGLELEIEHVFPQSRLPRGAATGTASGPCSPRGSPRRSDTGSSGAEKNQSCPGSHILRIRFLAMVRWRTSEAIALGSPAGQPLHPSFVYRMPGLRLQLPVGLNSPRNAASQSAAAGYGCNPTAVVLLLI